MKKILKDWLDVILLLIGMAALSIGMFQIYFPIGLVTSGVCFIALAFFYANKQSKGGDGS